MEREPITGDDMSSDEDNLRKAHGKGKKQSNDPFNDGSDVHEVGGDQVNARKKTALKQSAKEREGTSLRKQAKKHKMGVGSFAHHVTTHPGAFDGVLHKKANLSLAMIGRGSSHSKKPTKQRGFEY